jgi:hypothetical protein
MGPFGAFPAYAAPQVAGYALPPQMEMMQQAPPMHLGHGLGVPPQAVPPPQPRPRAPKPSKKKPAKKKPAKKKPPKPKPKKKGPTKKELEKKRRAKEREKREKEKLKTKAGRKKRARDPAAPKRARTAFNFFLDDFRAEYKKKHPETRGVVEVTKSGSQRWKTMTDKEKLKYEDMAAEAQVRYKKAKQEYEENEGPKKFRIAGATKPKRPPTAYFMFLCKYRSDYREAHPDVKGIMNMSKAAGEQWRAMDAAGKKVFEQRALDAKAEYMRIKELPLEERKPYIEDDKLYKRFERGEY